MYSVRFSQFLHASQKSETSSATYTTYTELTDAIIGYFNERKGRYPNEILTYSYNRTFYSVAELPQILRDLESPVERGEVRHINLELDGTTHFGYPILQTVELSIPDRVTELYAKNAAERFANNGGRVCYCGYSDCEWDCGLLACGCIDVCRGRCGLRWY